MKARQDEYRTRNSWSFKYPVRQIRCLISSSHIAEKVSSINQPSPPATTNWGRKFVSRRICANARKSVKRFLRGSSVPTNNKKSFSILNRANDDSSREAGTKAARGAS